MEKLLIAMVEDLVDDKSAIRVTVDEPKEDGTVVYHLHVAPDDMGRVIGQQGSRRIVYPGYFTADIHELL